MKLKLKSLLALILAMCMALSLLSTTVWAAEDGSVSAAASEVQAEEPEEPEAEEDDAPSEEPEASEEESPSEEPEASEEESPSEEPEASEEEAPIEEPAAGEEAAPAEEPEAAEESAEAEVETQSKPSYHPMALSTKMSGSQISATITHGTRPLPAKNGMKIIVEGAIDGTNTWQTCEYLELSNAWGYGETSLSCQSGDGSWKYLTLTTRTKYVFRACYTNEYGERSDYAYSQPMTYYSKTQETALLKQRIQNYLTVGLSAKEGENKVYTSAYDEKGLTANQTELLYNRPLYQLDVTFNGTDTSNPDLLKFHATYTSRVRDNGFQEGNDQYVEGLDFRLEGLWFVNQKGEEQFQSLSESAGQQDFTVNLSEMGSGCNYIKPRLICYDRCGSGVKEYWVEEPIYFNVGFSATPLNTYSALTTKNAITLKPCTNYGGTLAYDDALPAAKGNVNEIGVFVWYRKKGTSRWTRKTFTGTNPPVITRLTPDTVYQWRAQYYIKSTDHTGAVQTITAPVTKVFNVCTAVSAKPKVKSCKVSKAKVVKHTIAGHYEKSGTNSLKWVKKQVWYTTDFTVTYTFAKPSRNIKGYTSGGVYAPVKNGKVTFKMSVNSGKKKKKAKKFSTRLQSCTNINGPGVDVTGLSPVLKYNGKIK